jgi:hypothetical protein
MKKNIILICCLLLASFSSYSQDQAGQLSDNFLDSLVTYFENGGEKTHFLTARVRYTNKALFAGRDFGVNQSMLMPSVSYLHKSGLYADFTGYAYSQSSPRYQFSNVSVGYMGVLGSKFLYSAEYGRSISSTKEVPNVLANSFALQGSFTHKKLVASLNYSFYFDNSQSSHLLVPSVGLNLSTKKIGFIDKISFMPSINAVFGNSGSFQNTFNATVPTTSDGTTSRPWGTGPPPWVKADSSQIAQRPSWVTNGGQPAWGSNNPYLSQAQNSFGLLSVGISGLFSVKIKQTTLSFTSNLTKPFAVNSIEQFSGKPQFNFSIGLSHSFGWK